MIVKIRCLCLALALAPALAPGLALIVAVRVGQTTSLRPIVPWPGCHSILVRHNFRFIATLACSSDIERVANGPHGILASPPE